MLSEKVKISLSCQLSISIAPFLSILCLLVVACFILGPTSTLAITTGFLFSHSFVVNPQIEVLRARFSEITNASVNRAIATLAPPDSLQNDAVEVRRELDLRIGNAL